MWFQRSQAMWATHGDKNSKYFHSRATQQYWKNRIKGIKDSSGQWCLDIRRIARVVLEFYCNLLSFPNTCQPNLVLDSIQRIVIDDMNSQLSSYFMECKVKVALNQMAPLKSPGPDSMPPLFYQHYWDLVGKDISTFVLSFLNSASLHDYLNHTFITLIRKVKNPKLVSEF